MLEPDSEKTFRVKRMMRGVLKARMIKLGFPVDDRIPLKKGKPLEIKLRDTFKPRPYQTDAVKALLGDGGNGSGYGTIVLPCGSGKTVAGILAMAALGTRTLILCPNVTAVHQWIRELLDKTELTENEVGEYSGEKKDMKPVTVCTYQIITWRPDTDSDYPRFSLFRDGGWGFIIYDEVHMLPAPVFRITAELQAIHRLGLTATLVREDGREDEVFSLVGPKRYDTPWSELEAQGFIAKAYCHEIRLPLPEDLEIKYAVAKKREKYRFAAENPLKAEAAKRIIREHEGESILMLEQLESFRKEFGYPIITGSTPTKKRDELYALFREGKVKVLIVSKVANSAIDLPDASVAIQISGTFGSRQEEAQRLGRILRPKDRDSHFYTLVTEYTEEEEFAQNRQKFLSEQGYSYTILKRFERESVKVISDEESVLLTAAYISPESLSGEEAASLLDRGLMSVEDGRRRITDLGMKGVSRYPLFGKEGQRQLYPEAFFPFLFATVASHSLPSGRWQRAISSDFFTSIFPSVDKTRVLEAASRSIGRLIELGVIKETSTLQNPPILETSFYEIYEISEDYERPLSGYSYGVFDGFRNMNGLQFSTTAEDNKYTISIVLDTIMNDRKLFSEGEITYELTENGQMKYTWDTLNHFTADEEIHAYHQLDTVMYKEE